MTPPNLTLPTDSAERKNIPFATGLIDYFPAALAYVARISQYGNDKHNPGEDMHHARGKSMDHANCIGRHLVDRGLHEPDSGLRHSGFMAWRALALLQEELELAEGAPLPRGARLAPAVRGEMCFDVPSVTLEAIAEAREQVERAKASAPLPASVVAFVNAAIPVDCYCSITERCRCGR